MMAHRFWRVSLALAPLALAAALVPTAPAAAQVTRQLAQPLPGSMGIPEPEPLITLNLQNKTLPRVLYEMFKQTPYQYRVPAETGATLYNINVTKQPLTQVLKDLLAQDKAPDPLVFYFNRSLTGGGQFTIDREYIDLGPSNEGEYKVSLTNARLTKVLPKLFQLMRVNGRVDADVPPVTINLQLRPMSWDQVLPAVILEAYKTEPTLTYSYDSNHVLIVHLQKTPVGVAPNGSVAQGVRRVQLALANTPLRDALAQLFKGSTWKYEVASDVKDIPITYSVPAEPELSALRSVLRQASAKGAKVTYREGKGVLYIEPGYFPGDAGVVKREDPTKPRTSSINANVQPLKAVLKSVADATGSTVEVSPLIPDLPVTFKASGTMEDILKAFIEATKPIIPNISYRNTGANSYLVELGGN